MDLTSTIARYMLSPSRSWLEERLPIRATSLFLSRVLSWWPSGSRSASARSDATRALPEPRESVLRPVDSVREPEPDPWQVSEELRGVMAELVVDTKDVVDKRGGLSRAKKLLPVVQAQVELKKKEAEEARKKGVVSKIVGAAKTMLVDSKEKLKPGIKNKEVAAVGCRIEFSENALRSAERNVSGARDAFKHAYELQMEKVGKLASLLEGIRQDSPDRETYIVRLSVAKAEWLKEWCRAGSDDKTARAARIGLYQSLSEDLFDMAVKRAGAKFSVGGSVPRYDCYNHVFDSISIPKRLQHVDIYIGGVNTLEEIERDAEEDLERFASLLPGYAAIRDQRDSALLALKEGCQNPGEEYRTRYNSYNKIAIEKVVGYKEIYERYQKVISGIEPVRDLKRKFSGQLINSKGQDKNDRDYCEKVILLYQNLVDFKFHLAKEFYFDRSVKEDPISAPGIAIDVPKLEAAFAKSRRLWGRFYRKASRNAVNLISEAYSLENGRKRHGDELAKRSKEIVRLRFEDDVLRMKMNRRIADFSDGFYSSSN